jgi:hypothetical protein
MAGRTSPPVVVPNAPVLLVVPLRPLLLLLPRREKPRVRLWDLDDKKLSMRRKDDGVRFTTFTVAVLPLFEPSESSSPLPGPSLSESENSWMDPIVPPAPVVLASGGRRCSDAVVCGDGTGWGESSEAIKIDRQYQSNRSVD